MIMQKNFEAIEFDLRRFALNRLKCPNLVNEAVQNTLIRLSRITVQPENPEAVIMTAMKWAVLNLQRGSKSFKKVKLSAIADLQSDDESVDLKIERQQYSELLKFNISVLPEAQRLVVEAILAGETLTEYAERESLNRNTVGANYKHAISALRKILT